MEALVLERKGELSIREIALPTEAGAHDVKIGIHREADARKRRTPHP